MNKGVFRRMGSEAIRCQRPKAAGEPPLRRPYSSSHRRCRECLTDAKAIRSRTAARQGFLPALVQFLQRH
jgi:hypothetical protein